MNFKLCLLAFVMIASPAWAGWTYVDTDVKDSQFFINFETLRKDGNIRRVWQKVEFTKATHLGWGSIRQRNEYDCKNETKSILSAAAFSRGNLEGERLFEANKIIEKEDVAPDSVDWRVLKLVCSK